LNSDYDRGFGVDSGYNYQIAAGDTASPCRTEFAGAAGYTEKYPMAKYSPGQKVCLNWPSKNHVVSILCCFFFCFVFVCFCFDSMTIMKKERKENIINIKTKK